MKTVFLIIFQIAYIIVGKSQSTMYQRIGESELELNPTERFQFNKEMDWYGDKELSFSFIVLPMDIAPNPDKSRNPFISNEINIVDSLNFQVDSESIPLYLVKNNYMSREESIEGVSVFDDTKNLIMLNVHFKDLNIFLQNKIELVACLSSMRKRKS